MSPIGLWAIRFGRTEHRPPTLLSPDYVRIPVNNDNKWLKKGSFSTT